MDFNSICSVLGLIIAVFAARHDLIGGVSLVRHRSLQSQLDKVKDKLLFIKRLKREPTFLIAHISKCIFILLCMIIFIVLWNSILFRREGLSPDIFFISIGFSYLFFWLVGFVCGTGYRYCKYVINYDEYELKFLHKQNLLYEKIRIHTEKAS